jgi:hypothetical protein
MTKPHSCPKTCEYCDKRGVPILPLRYAVASVGESAGATASQSAPVTGAPSIGLPAGTAHYTHRVLRSGYLYVYDEARDRWDDYFVTVDGYFFRLTMIPGRPLVLPQKPFDCPDLSHAAVASCITIPDASRATQVWLGFSDVQWTEAVRSLHASQDYRKRHMRCVDVKSYAASIDKSHCFSVTQVEAKVAEYALKLEPLQKAVGWSPFPISKRHGFAPQLVKACERLAPGKGFAVVLSDPAGVASELGALMQHSFDTFVNRPGHKRELAASNAIIQLEAFVREQARVLEEQAGEDLANQQLASNPLGHALFESTRQATEDIRTTTPAEAKRAEDQTWKKYSVKFKEAQAKAWRQEFDGKLKALDASCIAPLAKAHVAWMKHKKMAAAFECNFDATNAECGLAYAKVLQICIGSTQDKAACFDLYTQWLGGDLTDKANLLLRALVLNLDATANDVQAAAKVNLDWRGFPLDQLAGNFGKAIERVTAGHPDAVGRLVQMVGGPIGKWLTQAVDGKVRAGMAALSLNTGMGFAVVEVTGGKKAFRTELIKALIQASGQVPNENQMRRAVAAQLRRLDVAGVPMEGTEKKRFLVMVDPQVASGMPQGTAAQRATWLASHIRTPEQFGELANNNWRIRLSNPGAGMSVLKGGIPYVAGLVGAILQYNAMQKLAEDDGKAMKHEAQEALWRLRAGVMALGGTITELAGMAVEKLAVAVPRMARGFAWVGNALQVIGRGAGLAGALVMAWMDFQKASEASAEKQSGLAWAYASSGVVGIAAAAAILFGWTGIGLILVVVLVAVTVLIEYFKDNKLQDWLERCIWGAGPAAPYESSEIEMAQFKQAVS